MQTLLLLVLHIHTLAQWTDTHTFTMRGTHFYTRCAAHIHTYTCSRISLYYICDFRICVYFLLLCCKCTCAYMFTYIHVADARSTRTHIHILGPLQMISDCNHIYMCVCVYIHPHIRCAEHTYIYFDLVIMVGYMYMCVCVYIHSYIRCAKLKTPCQKRRAE